MAIKLSSLKPNPGNPRLIKDSRFKKLVQSIKEFPKMMELRPIVIDKTKVIIGGNMRYKALLELGETEVPDTWVKRADQLTEEERRRFIISDNNQFGENDWDSLANGWDLEELKDWGLEIPGFAIPEPNAIEDDFTIPDEIITDIVSGDLFEIGQHRLLCGDSGNKNEIATLTGGGICNMVFTDPPYGISFQSNMRTKSKKFDVIKNDDIFITNWVEHIPHFSQGFVFVWTTWKVLAPWIKFLQPIGELTNMIIWDKGGGGLGNLKGTFSTDYEIALVYSRGAEIHGKRLGSVWSIGKDGATTYKHPTQKPVALAATAIENIIGINELVLDLFLGSGTTMVAAHQLKRVCYGMELDPKYCQVIIDRMKKLDPSLIIKKNGVLI